MPGGSDVKVRRGAIDSHMRASFSHAAHRGSTTEAAPLSTNDDDDDDGAPLSILNIHKPPSCWHIWSFQSLLCVRRHGCGPSDT